MIKKIMSLLTVIVVGGLLLTIQSLNTHWGNAVQDYIEANNKLTEQTELLIDNVEGLKYQNDKLRADKQNLIDTINSFKGMEFRVEVTYYSSDEPTDVAGYETKNSIGGNLKIGDWAAPDFIPLHSLLQITYDDGTQEIAYIIDRGNPDVIKVFDREDKRIIKDSSMRLDKYVHDVNGKGVDGATVKILRWGE